MNWKQLKQRVKRRRVRENAFISTNPSLVSPRLVEQLIEKGYLK